MNARDLRPAGFFVVLALGAAFLGCGGSSPTEPDRAPNLRDVIAQPSAVVLGGLTRVTALASDPDGDPITYRWRSAAGSFSDTTSASATWIAPETAGAYVVAVTVRDATHAVSDSVTVLVGEGSLTVLSDPPGAGVSLDGDLIGYTTPHTYERVAIGDHSVAVVSGDYAWSPTILDDYVGHGDADTVRFTLPATTFEVLNTGRTDIERVGGLAWLPTGTGVVFAAVTTADGAGIYTTTLSPRTGEANGVLLTTEVRVDESLAVSADGEWLFYTNPTGTLVASRLYDAGGDGLVDSLGTGAYPLRTGSYGPAISANGRLAFTLGPVESVDAIPVLWGEFADGVLGAPVLVTTDGRRPAWRPSGGRIAYERAGLVYARDIDGATPGPETGFVEEGGGTAGFPAWSPRSQAHLAYAYGPGADPTEIRIQIPGTSDPVTVFTGLFAPSAVAWSPVQRVIAVAHNPGHGQIVLVLDVPVP